MPDPKSRVDRSLPWVVVAWAIGAVLLTALSGVPAKLPGIALHSTGIFLLERGVVVLGLFVAATTIMGRGLKRELPRGLSTALASVTYAETVAEATTSSEAAVAELEERLDKQDAELSAQGETLTGLGDIVAALARKDKSKQPADPPER